MSHVFDPGNMGVLEDEARLEELPPRRIVEHLEDGEVLLDLGCGPGLYTSAVAAAVGGRVVGVDLQVEMLNRFRERGVPRNVRLVRCIGSALPFRGSSVSSVFGVHVLHEVFGSGTLAEVNRVLCPGGAVVLVDWRKREMERGPPTEDRVSLTEARRLLRATGFDVAVEEVLESVYLVVGRKE